MRKIIVLEDDQLDSYHINKAIKQLAGELSKDSPELITENVIHATSWDSLLRDHPGLQFSDIGTVFLDHNMPGANGDMVYKILNEENSGFKGEVIGTSTGTDVDGKNAQDDYKPALEVRITKEQIPGMLKERVRAYWNEPTREITAEMDKVK